MDTKSERAEGTDLEAKLRQPGWHWPLALLFASFYVFSSLYISAHRMLWFDEILTALVSRLPNWRVLWKALTEIEEQTPPLYFLITRAFDQMFHHADIGLRVPSALALGAGLLFTFDTARRLTDGLYGLIAMSLLATPFVTYYGYEARAYAIYFLFAAIALWLWVFTEAGNPVAAAAFGAVFLIGVAIHYYFILCLLPFGVMALAQRRIFHPKVMAAAAGAMVSLAVLYPQIANSRNFANTISAVWAPSISGLFAAYREFLPNTILLAAALAIGFVVYFRPRHPRAASISAGERVSWLFLALPLAAYLLGHLVTHSFHDRYVIGAGPGIAVGLTCLLWRYCREWRHLSAALLLVFGGYAVTQQLHTLRNIDHIRSDSGDYQERTREVLAIEDPLLREGKRHVVLFWDVEYLETWYYSKHRSLYECITSEKRWTIQKYVPLQFVTAEVVNGNAPETALINPTPAMGQALARAGLRLKVLFAQPQTVVASIEKRPAVAHWQATK
ncbi:MAG: glycosyltransferase family 39 protein [Candidatus Acidiferrales bacterium]